MSDYITDSKTKKVALFMLASAVIWFLYECYSGLYHCLFDPATC